MWVLNFKTYDANSTNVYVCIIPKNDMSLLWGNVYFSYKSFVRAKIAIRQKVNLIQISVVTFSILNGIYIRRGS